jgi:hypothetical protein
MIMFGFLKRLFGRAFKRVREQPVSPIEPVVIAPVFVEPVAPAPVATPEPVFAAPPPFVPAPAPAPAPTLMFDDEPEGEFGMVQSVGSPDAYMIGLVGEQDHVQAVSELAPGMPIFLQLEPDNPHDNSAIAAVDSYNRVIGYIAPDSWLREAIYGGGAGFSARVLATEMGSRGFREVVLEVEPAEEELRERRYRALV